MLNGTDALDVYLFPDERQEGFVPGSADSDATEVILTPHISGNLHKYIREDLSRSLVHPCYPVMKSEEKEQIVLRRMFL